MKKRFLTLILTFATMLMCIFGLSACNKEEFKVNFMVDGLVYATVNTNGAETIKMPDNPIKEDYIFDGWYWDENTWQEPFTANSLLNAPLSSNMSVYAKFTEGSNVKGTDIRMDGYTFTDDESLGKVYYISLPNNKIVYAIYEDVTVHNKSTWTLSTDISGNNTIASKTVELAVGNNVYYVLVTDKVGNVKQHIIVVRRRPIYTISFNTNGGSYCAPQGVEEGALATTPVSPEKTGYTFEKWKWDFSVPIFGNTTISAQWTANKYFIYYDANEGTLVNTRQIVEYDQQYTLFTPTRNGYTFKGWYKGNEKVDNGKWEVVEDWHLTAQWTANSNAITYNLDGGKNHTSNPSSYITGTAVTLGRPTKTGYDFVGWTTAGITTPTQEMSILAGEYGTKIFVAHWTANEYTVTYNANGGVASKKTDTATYDSKFTLATAERTGYTFDGWYDGNTKVVDGYWKIAYDVNLKAKWEENPYTIYYDTKGGTLSNTEQTVTYDSEYTLKEPKRAGYTFLYWAYNGEEFKNGTWNLTNSVTLIAEWQVNEYTVTYNANGGKCDMVSDIVTYDETYTVPTPTRVGYTFDGWYDGDTEYSGGTWRTANNVILKAKWVAHTNIPYTVNHYLQNLENDGYTLEKSQELKGISDYYVTPAVNTYIGFTSPIAQQVQISPDGKLVVDYRYKRNFYTITLVGNGGNVIAEQRYKYQETLDIPNPTRTGYTFGGWFTDEGLLSAFNSVKMPASNKTLYAWWSEENKPADFTYTGTSEITISGYVGESSTMWIPAYIGGKSVTTILESAVENKTGLAKVVVPDTVTSIGVGAFKGCNGIEDITLPFVGASESATCYDAVFGYIFGTTTAIVDSATGYPYYYDGATGEKIRNYTTYGEGNTEFVNYRAGTTTAIYDPIGAIWQYSCYDYKSKGYYYMRCCYYYIPTNIKQVTITKQTNISVAAFNNCDFIETITLSADVETIGGYAFQNCNALTNLNSEAQGVLNIPSRVTAINEYTFHNCSNITTVTLGVNVTSIGQYAFAGCGAITKFNSHNENEFVVPNKVITIGDYAFQDLTLIKKVVVADSVTSIGLGAFKGCNTIEDITLPFVGASADATYYDAVFGYIFGRTTAIVDSSTGYPYYYDGVTGERIRSYTTYKESHTEFVNYRAGTTTVMYEPIDAIWQYSCYDYKYDRYYYMRCCYYYIPTNIKQVTITKQTNIPVAAFNGCDFIETITLSVDVENIGDYAFQNCNAKIQYA